MSYLHARVPEGVIVAFARVLRQPDFAAEDTATCSGQSITVNDSSAPECFRRAHKYGCVYNESATYNHV